METSITKVHQHLDRILKYLNPLLPLANCHMVEFFTENHWEKLLPKNLIQTIDKWDLNSAVEKFWTYASEPKKNNNCELSKWIHKAQNHSLSVNNDYCISVEELEQHLQCWGGSVLPEIKITEFMTSKKSYEKQWRAIAKKITNGNEELFIDNKQCNIHRFATSFITNKTNVAKIMKEAFPEHYENDYKVLLTGLHTCGNLGPDSLRIFSSQTSTTALFNVPCCYHLLTEKVDADLFDVFQRDYGCGTSEHGFPMSEYLRGYNLGRNARMLAAQSLDRVLHYRQLPDKSLLYRALFQIIVKTHLPKSNLKDGKLKKIASKCDNFTQYFKMADKVLSLGLFDRLPDSYLTDVSNDLHCQWKQIVMFNLLRLCLAQVIESVVLLDRLLYLLENGYRKSYIVKLFDPVMSPRCHSIVAVR
ncbi:PREDICTED: uncharacterized protein LOC106101592 isoform X3 [Papilio polytes]|uniref:uncharacterized protein LOC106101592 isoform X3 n=1 Tax=Papilio polytes TaxID=76194 RepID=UPI000675E9FC|nr:PREDICTED: uncharacterized protein LOC106101592 isoform X3 [Papilio polytes]